MKHQFNVIITTFVLFLINILGLAFWKFGRPSPNNASARVTRSHLAIVTSCIIFILVMYCLVSVLTLSIPGDGNIKNAEIHHISEYFAKVMTYIQVPIVIIPVWWYSRSWKKVYETVDKIDGIFANRIHIKLNTHLVVAQISKRLFPIFLYNIIFTFIYGWSLKRLFDVTAGMAFSWEYLCAGISANIYVCVCVLHHTLTLSYVVCVMCNIKKLLLEL